MKIYTKKGDRGETSLFGGKRVVKASPRIEAYGAVDELNSCLGIVLSILNYSSSEHSESRSSRQARTIQMLLRIQKELLFLGSDLSAPIDLKIKTLRINKSFTTRLEREIDEMSKKLPELKNFILPGGNAVGAQLHLARTICRRTERAIVELAAEEKINTNAISYINRLSDWLFTLARYVNKLDDVGETIWKVRT